MEPAITVTNLRKTFRLSAKQRKLERTDARTKTAVDGLTFEVRRGEIYGLLGPNGAGKTTTLRMLAALVKPDEGSAFVEGVSVVDDPMRVRGIIGFLTSELKLEETFSPDYLFDFFSELHHVEPAVRDARKKALFGRFGIDRFAQTKVADLSTGMKQKTSLAVSLVHDPDVIIFDEPTNGLDPSGIVEMRAFLQGLNRDKGITIVISSHHLAELEQMATTYAFLKRGCVVEQVSARTLQERCADYVDIAVSDAARFTALLEKELRHERYLVLLDGTVRIFDPAAGIEAYSGLAARAGMDVSKLERRKMSLEQYYLELKEKGVA